MSNTMKCLQIIAPDKVDWRDVPVPQPQPGEVLLKVQQVNTCPHWDMHLLDDVPMFPGGTLDYPYTPGQPGHEAVGTIEAVGSAVQDLSVGQRVACWKDPGHQRQGCYAHYVPMDAEHVLPIPDHVDWDQATSLELAMCVQVSFDQLMRMDGVRGKRVAVGGLGAAGLVAVQMARAYGATHVTGVEPLPQRRQRALALGCDRVVDPLSGEWPAGRRGDLAADTSVDCTGLPASIEFLMDRSRQAVTIFGVLREHVTFGPQHVGGLYLMGYEGHSKGAAERALQLIADGKLNLTVLISAKLPFTRYRDGIAMLRRKDAVKICYQPWSE